MGIGDLVRNTRASIGIPKGTVGLIINKHQTEIGTGYIIYEIQWFGAQINYSRRLQMDLEVIE